MTKEEAYKRIEEDRYKVKDKAYWLKGEYIGSTVDGNKRTWHFPDGKEYTEDVV
jgi:hypothetical protein